MNKKEKDDDDMQTTLSPAEKRRKEKIQAIFDKAVKANGKALEKLSKN